MSAIILPALMDLRGGDGNRVLNVFIIGVGVVLMGLGAGSSIVSIYDELV